MKRIIGIDPGRTTGFVDLLEDDDGALHVLEAMEVLWDERFRLRELIEGMPIQVDERNQDEPLYLSPHAIVIEAFNLRAADAHHQVGSDFPSVRIIGIVEAFANDLGVLGRIVYQPASLKEFVKLKNKLPASDHIEDAYRHARYFAVRERNKR